MLESLKYASLKAGVQRHIFCQSCRTVMDVRRAVETTVYGADDKIVGMNFVCTKCFDKHGGKEKVETFLAKKGVTFSKVEILDGREADWDLVEMLTSL